MAEARFEGTCKCGQRYAAGASVRWDRIGGKLIAIECPLCHPDVHAKATTPAAARLNLKVRIQRVRFSKPDGSWTVTEALLLEPLPPDTDSPLAEGRPFSLVGRLGLLDIGDMLEVAGNFSHDPKWGWQFLAKSAIPVVAATEQALRAFLAKVPQVGARRAELILQALGSREAVIEALERNPSALTVVAGITEERAVAIAKAYQELAELRESALFLAGLDLGEALTAQILDEYGQDAKLVLEEDPYQLTALAGVGFKKADDIARRLHVRKDDPRRLAAAALYLLEATADQGHTYATLNDLLSVT